MNDDVAGEAVEAGAEHAKPSAHDGDDDEDHGGAKGDGQERDPGDAAFAEVFEDEVEFVQGEVVGCWLAGIATPERIIFSSVTIKGKVHTAPARDSL